MYKYRKKGFTLIELIVVIAIIGVLAAILIPAMLGYVAKARRRSDVATAKELYNEVFDILSEDDEPAAAFYEHCNFTETVTVKSETYNIKVVARKDANDAASKWLTGNRELQPFLDELNDTDTRNLPIKYRKSDKGERLDRYYVCYRADNKDTVEIWVGSGLDNEPKYRLYPEPQEKY